MSSAEWQVTLFTLITALSGTALVALPGIALGWLLARRDWWGKSVLETLLTLPLVLPPVATGFLLLLLLGRRGILGSSFEQHLGWEIAFTWRGVIVAGAVMALPLMVRTARIAFEEVNPRLEQIARTLGAGPLRVFATITLPLAARGLAGGAVLTFARVMGEFGATVILAGNIPGETATLSLTIHRLLQLGDDSAALRLIALSAAIAFGAVWSSERLLRRPRPAGL